MNYSKFKIEDFVQDEQFVQWVKHPNTAGEVFGANFLAQYPEKAETVAAAKDLLLAISNQRVYQLSKEKEDEILDNINGVIDAKPTLYITYKRWYWAAASVAAFVIGGISFLYLMQNRGNTEEGAEDRVAVAKMKMTEKSNNSVEPIQVLLSDGSRVTLHKDSRLRYSDNFNGQVREVYLSGEAFFEVTKDAARPFMVYANGLVTKVLGTSFTVSAYDTDKAVKVAVKTGKVSVFSQKDKNEQGKGLVILPNQQIIFDKAEVRMIKSVVEQPTILDNTVETTSFEFVDVPIKVVFQRLQKAYGIEIVYDEDVMQECYLTASLYEEKSMYDKLKLICKVTESRYEVTDGKVVIQSRGCK